MKIAPPDNFESVSTATCLFVMKNVSLLPARMCGHFGALLLALFSLWTSPRSFAANAAPPELLSYQGFLTDAAGDPLGNSGPKNYDVLFRIWSDQTGGSKLWAEQQTVTVDKGYFSVLLGEGAPLPLEPNVSLSLLFVDKAASDRFVEMTVKGIGTGSPAGDVVIQPRLRLLTAPYAFLAQSALKLVNNTGSDLVTSDINGLKVIGNIAATSLSGKGTGSTDINATNITLGTLPNARLDPNPVITGTLSAAKFSGSGEGLTSLNGANLNNGSIDLDKLVAAVKAALCPVGTISAYAGDTAPEGWYLCDGKAVSTTTNVALYAVVGTRFGAPDNPKGYFNLPDFRGRFLRGRDGGAGLDPDRASRTNFAGGALGDSVGSTQSDTLKKHAHDYLDIFFSKTGAFPFTNSIGGFSTTLLPSGANIGDGNTDNSTFANRGYQTPRATADAGGGETRPVNVYVNYIIKY